VELGAAVLQAGRGKLCSRRRTEMFFVVIATHNLKNAHCIKIVVIVILLKNPSI
jgi:hypothetical protein